MTERRLGLIVTDASPLITLGAAHALSCLLMPDVQVLIPDMVYAEVTRDMAKLGAGDVVEWLQANRGPVQIAPTTVYAEFEALRTINPQTRSEDRGERAALEVLGYETAHDPELQAMLLFEDTDIGSRQFVRLLPERASAISTGDFLHELEAAGRIQSADHVLDEATARARSADPARIVPISRCRSGGQMMAQATPGGDDNATRVIRPHAFGFGGASAT